MTASPTLTVLATAHNPGRFLRPAVESVLAQSFGDFEFILVDDGSTDGSFDELETIDDPRLIVQHQAQQGLGKPVNRWLREARGEFIMRMDADDLIHEDRAARQIDYLRTHPDVGLVGCQNQFITDLGGGPSSKLPTNHGEIAKGIAGGWHVISHATTMYRTALIRSGLSYTWEGPGEDWSFLTDAARLAKVAVLDDVLYYYRLHESSSALRGARQMIEGMAYARQREAAILAGATPPTQDEFLNARASVIMSTVDRTRALSAAMYRVAVVHQIPGRRTRAAATKAAAAALDPVKTAGWLSKSIGQKRSSG